MTMRNGSECVPVGVNDVLKRFGTRRKTYPCSRVQGIRVPPKALRGNIGLDHND